MIIEELSKKIRSVKEKNTQLFFITRVLKQGIKKTSKVLDKFLFKVYQIDINDEIMKHLHSLTVDQLSYLLKKKHELHEYDVITDDSQQFFTYAMKNKAMSFADVVYNQLKSTPPKVTSLSDIVAEEELWAYCVGFYYKQNDWIYTFRKVLPGKIGIDEKENMKLSQKVIRTLFNTKSQKLELLKGDTINLDKRVDCIFYDETFFIAHKGSFEQIVGLEEEYRLQAKDVLSELKNTEMIVGLEYVEETIEKNPTIHKKLVRLYKIGNYRTLSATTINNMKKVCRQFGDQLKVKDGKLLIEDDKDIDLALKMLSDYYKRGEVSGKAYGTFAGKQLTPGNENS